VLLDPDAGEGAQDLTMATLRASNIGAVTDDDITTLADNVVTEGRSRRINCLVEQVHEYRGLATAFLVALRERLAGSDDPAGRAVAGDVSALLPRLDAAFASRMFGDRRPLVRASVVDSFEKVEPVALRLIRDQLAHETHRIVLSACYHTYRRPAARARASSWVH
jgi:hypothetical protein